MNMRDFFSTAAIAVIAATTALVTVAAAITATVSGESLIPSF